MKRVGQPFIKSLCSIYQIIVFFCFEKDQCNNWVRGALTGPHSGRYPKGLSVRLPRTAGAWRARAPFGVGSLGRTEMPPD